MPWLRHFALFVVFVAALFRPAAAGAFASAPDAGLQTRVGAFELVASTLVGPASAATCGLHEGIGRAYDENASGYRFAAEGVGTRSAEQTFEILDGVRRSKAVEMAGGSTIRAEVIGSGGRIVEVPLDALRSPKTVIDATTNSGLSRWLNTLRQTLGGSEPPPILVQPGARGTPIPQVTVEF